MKSFKIGNTFRCGFPFPRFLLVLSIVLVSMIHGAPESVKTQGQENAFYPNNRAPLLQTQYVKLPLGAVKPQGWLRDQLVVEANGLPGHLQEVWGVIKTSAWKGDAGANVTPEPCYARFCPRWMEGLILLSYELDDQHLKDITDPYMQYILNVQDLSTVTPSLTGWAHLGRVLPDYYEATHDERAVKLARKILDYGDSVKDSKQQAIVIPERVGMLLSFSWWYYNHTGDSDIPDLVDRCAKKDADQYRDYFADFQHKDKTAQPGFPTKPGESGLQGVDVTQSVLYPVMYYLKSKDESYKNSLFQGIASLDKFDGQVTGRWNADEWLAGNSPTSGTELCDIEELSYCLEKDFEALGDVSLPDRLEKLIFNAFPGTMMPDMWAHQYDQQANQVLVSVDARPWHNNGKDANIYGFSPNYPCCLANMGSPFPRYVEYMWMASNDNGLAAVAYGPSEVTARVADDATVAITEETNYPFEDTIKFTVKSDKPAAFPIYFRIPSWADQAELSVAGDAQPGHPVKGTMVKIVRTWKSGDVVNLAFHAVVRTETHRNNSVSIAWGPLYFVERIGEAFSKTKARDDRLVLPHHPLGVVDWRIDPTTDWNYALDIDRNHPECTKVTNKISALPFAQKGEPVWLPGADSYKPWTDDVPIVLSMKARKVDWNMNGANAGEVPLSPVQATGGDTTIELIPYGCSRLRISEFPTVN